MLECIAAMMYINPACVNSIDGLVRISVELINLTVILATFVPSSAAIAGRMTDTYRGRSPAFSLLAAACLRRFLV